MIIDELSAFGTRTARQNDARLLIHPFSLGNQKGRMGDRLWVGPKVRTILQTTANESGAELLGLETEHAAEAALDRLIDVPVPTGDEGVFNALHPDFVNSLARASEVGVRIGRHYGTAIPAFVQHLARIRAKHGDNFSADIRVLIEELKALPAVLKFGRVCSRVLDLFGLAYAAGRLAIHIGVLPASVDPEATVVHCLSLHLGKRVELDSMQQVLERITAHNVIDLRTRQLPSMTKQSLKRRGEFIVESRSGPQFLMHPDLFKAFKETLQMMRRLHARGILEADGKGSDRHSPKKRAVRGNVDPERFLVFNLPDFEGWLQQNGIERPRKRRR